MNQNYNFPMMGLNIEVNAGDWIDRPKVRFTQDGIEKEYRINEVRSSILDRTVFVYYALYLKDAAGNLILSENKCFDATKQETVEYFYNLPAKAMGEKQNMMCVNGLLLDLFGVLCFHPEYGIFIPPCTTVVKAMPTTWGFADESDPNTFRSNSDGSIEITPVDGEGPFMTQLIRPDDTTTNHAELLITDLPKGRYELRTFSNTNLPCIHVVEL